MAKEIYINEGLFEQASAEDIALATKVLASAKLIEDDWVVRPSSSVPNPCDSDYLCDPPPYIPFGFPGNVVDAIGKAAGDVTKAAGDVVDALGVRGLACDAVAVSAAGVCSANTSGAALAVCLAVAEEVRKECRKGG
ncbi:hypothetical protein [Stutzerimonas nitrititolerans]|uniref:hypothetical protein n=1 Tax=Stutzerimonas nitrititolerans TaxID=2482751 RepID=UPI0028973F35|nr:hypothetical protein [Stutzerimonas nitrititolerans]